MAIVAIDANVLVGLLDERDKWELVYHFGKLSTSLIVCSTRRSVC